MASWETLSGPEHAMDFRGEVSSIYLTEHNVLVRWIPQYVTKSGIYLPPTDDLPYVKGEVVRMGPGKRIKGKQIPMQVSVGDIVWLGKFEWHQRVMIGDDLYAIIKEDAIVAIVEEEYA